MEAVAVALRERHTPGSGEEQMATSIASIVVPAVLVAAGVLIIVFRAPIAQFYRGRYGRVFGSTSTRPARAFNDATMILVGSLAIFFGAVFLILNVQRIS